MTREDIVSCLSKVRGLKSGEQAALKHNAARPYQSADYQAVAAFMKIAPYGANAYEEEMLFPAVCCMCLWRTPQKGISFPKAVLSLKSDTTEKRFLSLLDEPLSVDSLFHIKLFRLMSMLAAKGKHVDWDALSYDLLYWNHPDRFIQKRWIREFYRIETNENADVIIKEEA